MTKPEIENWLHSWSKRFGVDCPQLETNLKKTLVVKGHIGLFNVVEGQAIGMYTVSSIYSDSVGFGRSRSYSDKIALYKGSNKQTVKHEFVHYVRDVKRRHWPLWLRDLYDSVLRPIGFEEERTREMEKQTWKEILKWYKTSWGL